MEALINLEREVRKKTSMTLDEYTHWGEYEGLPPTPRDAPGGPVGAVARPRPMGMARLTRQNTGKDLELRELRVLAAISKGEHKAAIRVQRAFRKFLAYHAFCGSPRLREPTGRALGADGTADGSTSSATSSGRPSQRRRQSLTPQERKKAAQDAALEAKEARKSGRSSAGSGRALGHSSSSRLLHEARVVSIEFVLTLTRVRRVLTSLVRPRYKPAVSSVAVEPSAEPSKAQRAKKSKVKPSLPAVARPSASS